MKMDFFQKFKLIHRPLACGQFVSFRYRLYVLNFICMSQKNRFYTKKWKWDISF